MPSLLDDMRGQSDSVFEGMLGALPLVARIELNEILRDAKARNLDIDKWAVLHELMKLHIVGAAPLPPHLEPAEKASSGRWTELLLESDVVRNACNASKMNNLRQQYFDECERALALSKGGTMTLAEAWEQVRHPLPPASDAQGANGDEGPVARPARRRSRQRRTNLET